MLANTGNKEDLEKKLTVLVFDKFKADEAEEDKKEKKTRVLMEEEGNESDSDSDGKIEFDEEDM